MLPGDVVGRSYKHILREIHKKQIKGHQNAPNFFKITLREELLLPSTEFKVGITSRTQDMLPNLPGPVTEDSGGLGVRPHGCQSNEASKGLVCLMKNIIWQTGKVSLTEPREQILKKG